MNSLEKVRQVAQEYNGPPDPDDGPMELALRSATMMVGPQFMAMLPEDPAMLDQGLTEMAAKLLEMRSDDAAEQLAIAARTGDEWQPLQLEAG